MNIKKCPLFIVILWSVFASGMEAAAGITSYLLTWPQQYMPERDRKDEVLLPFNSRIERFCRHFFGDDNDWLIDELDELNDGRTDSTVHNWAHALVNPQLDPWEIFVTTREMVKQRLAQHVQLQGHIADHTPSSASDQVERVAADGASKSKRTVLDYTAIVTVPDLRGNWEAYPRLLALVRLLTEEYELHVIVAFTGNGFRGTDNPAAYQAGLLSLLVRTLNGMRNTKVVYALGNHECRDPVHLALFRTSLKAMGVPFISNVSPFVKPSFVNPNDPNAWQTLADMTPNKDVSLYGFENGVPDFEAAQGICEHVPPFEPFHIEGNILFFPHIAGYGLFDGWKAPRKLLYIFDPSFLNSLAQLKTERDRMGDSRCSEVWMRWTETHKGCHHPILVATAMSFCTALKQLTARCPTGPINIVVMAQTHAQTGDFWELLFQAYEGQIMKACGNRFADLCIHFAGGGNRDDKKVIRGPNGKTCVYTASAQCLIPDVYVHVVAPPRLLSEKLVKGLHQFLKQPTVMHVVQQ
ncbi:MAG: hypothetical protein LBF84_01190 [Holosporales bacterium]|jgi:hypothetical protein|nr:hypothetical protein [Holosporales bacterium]